MLYCFLILLVTPHKIHKCGHGRTSLKPLAVTFASFFIFYFNHLSFQSPLANNFPICCLKIRVGCGNRNFNHTLHQFSFTFRLLTACCCGFRWNEVVYFSRNDTFTYTEFTLDDNVPIAFCPKNIIKPLLTNLTVSTSISKANNDDNDDNDEIAVTHSALRSNAEQFLQATSVGMRLEEVNVSPCQLILEFSK